MSKRIALWSFVLLLLAGSVVSVLAATGHFGALTDVGVKINKTQNAPNPGGIAGTKPHACPSVPPATLLCVQGTHRQPNHDANGCAIAPTCVPDTTSTNFSASPTSGTAPLGVRFFASVSSDARSIDFGDGQSTSVPICSSPSATFGSNCSPFSVVHTYTSAGTYAARLVTNPCPGMRCAMPVQFLGTVTIIVR